MTTATQTQIEFLTFREQIGLLIRYARDAQGKPYTVPEIAQGLGMSPQGLHYLLEGRNKSPQLETVRRTCKFFGVPLDYFDGKTKAECLKVLIRSQASQPKSVILEIDTQAQHLTDKGRRNLLGMMRLIGGLHYKSGKPR